MSQAPATVGSSTDSAAVGATQQGPVPTVAAPQTQTPVHLPAPSAPKAKSYAPKMAMPTKVEGTSGLSQMLTAVSDMTFTANYNLRVPNYVVPNTIVFFQTLGMCDNQMARTKRFTDANPDWHPFVSQLYMSVLIYYHVLKTQKVGNQISQEQSDFLDFLDDQFNVAHAKIPGPMIPFFQALAACSGPNDHYGNVTYGIPNNLNATQASHYLAVNRINAHLPSVIFILDQFMRLINRFAPVGAAPAALTLAVTDSHYMDIYGVAAAAGAANEVVMKTPTARVEINVSLAGMQGFFGTTNLWRSVLPFAAATNQSQYIAGAGANTLAFDQYLGFRGATAATSNMTYGWFREVGRIMQSYADFFRDSASLGAINTSGIGAIFIENQIMNTPNNAAILTAAAATRDVRYMAPGTPRYVINDAIEIDLYFQNTEVGLDLIAYQMGILTAFNSTWPVNAAAGTVWPGPLNGNVVIGPVWNRPAEEVTRALKPLRYYSNVISGYYHVPTAGKFN